MSAVGAASEAHGPAGVRRGPWFFDPFTPAVLQAVARYLVLQSFFLLGSIWFRKLAVRPHRPWLVLFGVGPGHPHAIALRIGLASHLAAAAGGTACGWAAGHST